MSKRLYLVGFVPLLATIALAVGPTAAQAAPPVWYNEGAPSPEGVTTQTIQWGNLSLKGAAEINCHNAIGGDATNTAGKALDDVWTFNAWGCESNFACPPGTRPGVEPQNLPWNGELTIVGGKLRGETKNVEIVIGCTVPPEDHVTGTTFITNATHKQEPLAPNGLKKGTSAAHPGFYQYDAASGELEAKGSGGTVTGKTEGEVKTLGYEAQEHVWGEL